MEMGSEKPIGTIEPEGVLNATMLTGSRFETFA